MKLLMAIIISAFLSTFNLWAQSDYSADDIQEIVPIDEPLEEAPPAPPPTEGDGETTETMTEEFNY